MVNKLPRGTRLIGNGFKRSFYSDKHETLLTKQKRLFPMQKFRPLQHSMVLPYDSPNFAFKNRPV